MTESYNYPPQGPGQPGPYGQPVGPPPDNNLVWGILTTVLCCLPLGIVSIVKANQVQSLWFQGQFAAAQKAADDARKWAIWSAISAAVIWVIIIVFYVVMFAFLVNSAPEFEGNF